MLWAALIVGYLLGSIPFGLLLTRQAGLGDVRAIGSGNIGATNVLRTGNKKIAGLTLLLDAGKAVAAGLVAKHVFDVAPLWGAAAALVGHCYPIWLRFKGGKGVATFFGGLFVSPWVLPLVAVATWLGMAFLFRFSSLAALVTAVLVLAVGWWLYPFQAVAAPLLVMVAVIFWRHRDNIGRLARGEESKIGSKG